MKPVSPPPPNPKWIGILPVIALCLTLLIDPFLLDSKVMRPKLIGLEIGLTWTAALWGISLLFCKALSWRKNYLCAAVWLYPAVWGIYRWTADVPALADAEFMRALLCALAFVMGAQIIPEQAPRYRRWVLWAWMGGVWSASAFALVHPSGEGRIAATFGNPIFFAAQLAMAIPIACGMFAGQKAWMRLALIVMMATMIYSLYGTATRAAWIGLISSLLFFGWLRTSQRAHRTALILLMAAGCFLFYRHTRAVWARSQMHRTIWKDTVRLWIERPVFGAGLGSFPVEIAKIASPEVRAEWLEKHVVLNHAHNEYLETLAETGLAGFGLFIGLFVLFFKEARALWRTDLPDRTMFAGLASATLALLIQNLGSVDMRFTISAVYLFLAMGLAISFKPRRERIAWPWPVFARLLLAGLLMAGVSKASVLFLRPYFAVKRFASASDAPGTLETASLQELQQSAAQNPRDVNLLARLGQRYLNDQRWLDAAGVYEKAYRLDGSRPDICNNLGNLYFMTGRREQAVALWERSIALDPDNVMAHLNLAEYYNSVGQLKKAASHCQEALRIDPRNEKASVLLRLLQE